MSGQKSQDVPPRIPNILHGAQKAEEKVFSILI